MVSPNTKPKKGGRFKVIKTMQTADGEYVEISGESDGEGVMLHLGGNIKQSGNSTGDIPSCLVFEDFAMLDEIAREVYNAVLALRNID